MVLKSQESLRLFTTNKPLAANLVDLDLPGKPHTWQAELDKQKALLQEKLRQRQMAEVPRGKN